jgi:hypothetical protein
MATEADPTTEPSLRPDAGGAVAPDGGRPSPTQTTTRPIGRGVSRPSEGAPASGTSTLDAGAADTGPAPRPHGDAAWVAAVPLDMPRVVNGGGPIVASPVLTSITFANYDWTPQVDDFVATIGGTSYWRQAVSEYGVGGATAAPAVHLGEGSPSNIDDSGIQTWLAAQITSNAAMPRPAPGTVYAIFFPHSTSVTFQGLQSCFTVGAYHNSFALGGANVVYAVVPECAEAGKSILQATTGAASHELVEAVTDPLPVSGPTAYGRVDDNHRYFEVVLGGGEVGDLCAQWPSSFFVPSDFSYLVQRTWSNSAAAAGLDPCQPSLPGETFFNAVPSLTDGVAILDGRVSQPTLGAQIAVGASKTIDVHLYSSDDIGSWTVSALNVPVHASNLVFAWDQTSGQNGDTLHLTIRVNGINGDFGGDPFLLTSTQGSTTNYWLGYVGQ